MLSVCCWSDAEDVCGMRSRRLIDFRWLGVIELPRPPTIDRATHPADDPHQGGLQLQASAGGLSITCDIPRKITFQEHGRVVMLEDEVALRFANKTFKDMS